MDSEEDNDDKTTKRKVPFKLSDGGGTGNLKSRLQAKYLYQRLLTSKSNKKKQKQRQLMVSMC